MRNWARDWELCEKATGALLGRKYRLPRRLKRQRKGIALSRDAT